MMYNLTYRLNEGLQVLLFRVPTSLRHTVIKFGFTEPRHYLLCRLHRLEPWLLTQDFLSTVGRKRKLHICMVEVSHAASCLIRKALDARSHLYSKMAHCHGFLETL